MKPSFEEIITLIQNRNIIQLGLENMTGFLEEIGNPHRKLKVIHIAGTNGKGSTLNFIREMLLEAGYQVGTFTTPAVFSYEEQISINKDPISKENFVEVFQHLTPPRETFEQREQVVLTEFECLTAMMFYFFAEVRPVDFVLVETGVGGRLDATNVTMPLLTVITNIGRDHMQLLGESKEDIANEKAGIIKRGVPLITAEEDEAILANFKQHTADKKAKLYALHHDFAISDREVGKANQSFSFVSPFRKVDSLQLSMLGEHQAKNAALALMTVDYLKTYQALMIKEDDIRKALKNATWKGRFEKVSERPLIYVDGAHNREGVAALASMLQDHFQEKNINVLFAATKEKEIEAMLSPLYEIVNEISFTSFEFPRAALATDLFQQSSFTNKRLVEDWQDEIEHQLSTLKEGDLFLITGSLYFIGQVKTFIIEHQRDHK
ncbi:bifunctional folylpolyglutamate synthase/dihydrofolate synthase [Alkalihalobacterium alkalinitrilicum]|uniref:bifunctional folylpolyglutamate synthase/dihydrofolate synthase n=1 Tax=Alkalihalobacterium alkalinitrilicum TaxID=427920 RepID=UPI001303970F|nr:folylpolyglutamate synthase/dihydrofolate synthase family protein [Alkalihalobacterium alkalinitrilicum]